MTAMVLVFAVVYPKTIAREGFAYKNAILIPNQENGSTVYSGKIQGIQTRFTVSPDKTVEFQYGGNIYGPYTAKEDPTAIPRDHDLAESMTGIELRQGEKILFRGGVLNSGENRYLYNEDGSMTGFEVSTYTSNGTVIDGKGNVTDPMEPSISTILDLMADPELTHKGDWRAWLAGLSLCIITAVSMLFADELFRRNLAFRIRNADQAEPSEWKIAGRYIVWTMFPFLAMMVFIAGLQ